MKFLYTSKYDLRAESLVTSSIVKSRVLRTVKYLHLAVTIFGLGNKH